MRVRRVLSRKREPNGGRVREATAHVVPLDVDDSTGATVDRFHEELDAAVEIALAERLNVDLPVRRVVLHAPPSSTKGSPSPTVRRPR